MNSLRLPKKVLFKLGNGTVLSQLYSNLLTLFPHQNIIIACPDTKHDFELHSYLENNEIRYFKGSEKNLFNRIQSATKDSVKMSIVRLTADNPFIPIDLIYRSIDFHLSSKSHFSSTRKYSEGKIVERYFPKGFSVDIFDYQLFHSIDSKLLSSSYKEHVIPYFYDICDFNKLTPESIGFYLSQKQLKECCSIDTYTDYQNALKIYNGII